jgi:hypothetical protein
MHNLRISFITILLLGLSACRSELDINRDPGRLTADQVAVQALLPSAEQFTANCYFGAASYGVQYPQYLAGQAIAQYAPYGFDDLWASLYRDAFPTLQDMIRLGEAREAYNYSGVARIMLGMNLLLAASIYGDLPYSQANQGEANLYPCYDPMQQLYEVHIPELLNGGLADLAKPASPDPALRALANDYIYGPSPSSPKRITTAQDQIVRWTRAGNGAKARYYLHLTRKNPAYYAQAIEFANKSLTSNADDFELIYPTSGTNTLQNPSWFSFLGNSPAKFMRPSSYLVNLMNGAGQYPGLTDPRLPLYADRAANANAVGVTPGADASQAGVTTNITPNVWHARVDAPVQILTYAEIKFILAEAHFQTGNRTEAYTNYLAGIRASMEKVGVAEAQITAYLTSPQVGKGAENLQLSDIMLQKYLALYLQMETWTDMRRYQYDPGVYLGLQKPTTIQLPGSPWIQRSNVADAEPGVNTCLPDFQSQGTMLWLFQ